MRQRLDSWQASWQEEHDERIRLEERLRAALRQLAEAAVDDGDDPTLRELVRVALEWHDIRRCFAFEPGSVDRDLLLRWYDDPRRLSFYAGQVESDAHPDD